MHGADAVLQPSVNLEGFSESENAESDAVLQAKRSRHHKMQLTVTQLPPSAWLTGYNYHQPHRKTVLWLHCYLQKSAQRPMCSVCRALSAGYVDKTKKGAHAIDKQVGLSGMTNCIAASIRHCLGAAFYSGASKLVTKTADKYLQQI